MQQNGSTYFARKPPPPRTLRVGSKGQNSIFSEQGHVAYQNNGNRKYSNMVAKSLPTDPLTTLGVGSKGQNSTFFRTWSYCISNLRESQKQQHNRTYFSRRPHPSDPVFGSKSQNSTFSNLRESQMQQHGSKY